MHTRTHTDTLIKKNVCHTNEHKCANTQTNKHNNTEICKQTNTTKTTNKHTKSQTSQKDFTYSYLCLTNDKTININTCMLFALCISLVAAFDVIKCCPSERWI